MSSFEKTIDKIRQGSILSLSEVQAILKYWGFIRRAGKGSHENWKHPYKNKILTLAIHGKELPRYITRELKKILEDL